MVGWKMSTSRSKELAPTVAVALGTVLFWLAVSASAPRSEISGRFLSHLYQEDDIADFHPFKSLLDEDEEIPTLFPFETADYIGFFCAVSGLILAAGAG